METIKKISQLLHCVKNKNPLIHQITNYVTANDCANVTLAIGASPVMADDFNEVKDMVALSSSLVINIGTLNSRSVESMIAAGIRANEMGIPVVLDPVGAGATAFRTETAQKIIKNVKLAAIRGNISEIKNLYGINTHTKGVDAGEELGESSEELMEEKRIASELAEKLNTVIAITGPIDIITNGRVLFEVENGNKLMSKITGTGCMCTALIGSFLGVADDHILAVLAGVSAMGIAGEIAYEKLNKQHEGTGSFKVKIMDAIYNLTGGHFLERGKIYKDGCRL